MGSAPSGNSAQCATPVRTQVHGALEGQAGACLPGACLAQVPQAVSHSIGAPELNLQPTQTKTSNPLKQPTCPHVLVVTSHPCVCRCSIGVTELDLLATNGAGLAAKAAEAEAAKAAGAGAAGAAALGDQGVVGQGSPSAQMTMDWLVHDLKQPRSLTLGQGVCWAESSVLERIQKCGRLLCEW